MSRYDFVLVLAVVVGFWVTVDRLAGRREAAEVRKFEERRLEIDQKVAEAFAKSPSIEIDTPVAAATEPPARAVYSVPASAVTVLTGDAATEAIAAAWRDGIVCTNVDWVRSGLRAAYVNVGTLHAGRGRLVCADAEVQRAFVVEMDFDNENRAAGPLLPAMYRAAGEARSKLGVPLKPNEGPIDFNPRER